mmetsp:Transcript_75636/g.225468  ORF Transcript_75636/g.225468 Transcript_75636/m.225468 type:complete len:303 (-) Transcript_75636:641-1549(-)
MQTSSVFLRRRQCLQNHSPSGTSTLLDWTQRRWQALPQTSPSQSSILASSLRLPHAMQGLALQSMHSHSPSGLSVRGGLAQARWQRRPQSLPAQASSSPGSPRRPQSMQQPAAREPPCWQTSQSHSPTGTPSSAGRQHWVWQARPQAVPSQRRSWSAPSGLPQRMHRTSSSSPSGGGFSPGLAHRLSLAMVNSHFSGSSIDITKFTTSPTAMACRRTKSDHPRHRNFAPLGGREHVTRSAKPRSETESRGTKRTLLAAGKWWAWSLGTLTNNRAVLLIRFENCGRPGDTGAARPALQSPGRP